MANMPLSTSEKLNHLVKLYETLSKGVKDPSDYEGHEKEATDTNNEIQGVNSGNPSAKNRAKRAQISQELEKAENEKI